MKLPFPIKINLVPIGKMIYNLIKRRTMCFRKKTPVEKPPETGNRTALLFAINDYPGASSDLCGCLNDLHDVRHMLDEYFPGFRIKPFVNSMATRKNFITEVSLAILGMKAGDFLLVHYSGHGTQTMDKSGDEEDGYDEALYLYDGTVIDDDIANVLMKIPEGATVLLMFDSCFSGSVTRAVQKWATIRYYQNPKLRPLMKKRIRVAREDMKWIVMSGCGEQQTSADAYIDKEYHGAFTYFALKALDPSMTYTEWFKKIRQYLPSKSFDQCPTLEGKNSLFNRKVFT